LEKEKNALTAEADELAENNEKLQKAKTSLEKNNRSMDAELSESRSAVSTVYTVASRRIKKKNSSQDKIYEPYRFSHEVIAY
jgi:predicted  nucleic acid-binding Zn-ribbon protein